jgi:hypothetical protein
MGDAGGGLGGAGGWVKRTCERLVPEKGMRCGDEDVQTFTIVKEDSVSAVHLCRSCLIDLLTTFALEDCRIDARRREKG